MTEQNAATSDDTLFTPVEIEQFEADDVVAGSAIGKMLSILFLYTVLVMSFVAYWTYAQADPAAPAANAAADH